MTDDVIIHFFKACRISSSTDGSDDGFIDCLKLGGVAHSAVEAIATESAHLNSRDGDDDVDPSAGDSEAEFEADLCGTG